MFRRAGPGTSRWKSESQLLHACSRVRIIESAWSLAKTTAFCLLSSQLGRLTGSKHWCTWSCAFNSMLSLVVCHSLRVHPSVLCCSYAQDCADGRPGLASKASLLALGSSPAICSAFLADTMLYVRQSSYRLAAFGGTSLRRTPLRQVHHAVTQTQHKSGVQEVATRDLGHTQGRVLCC